MRVPDKLCEVYYSAKHVAKPVQILDDLQQLVPGFSGAKNTIR